MNQLKEMLEAYRNGERGLPTYDELAAIADTEGKPGNLLTPDERDYYQSWLIADPSGEVERLRVASQALLDASCKNIASGENSEIATAADAVDEALAASVGFVSAKAAA